MNRLKVLSLRYVSSADPVCFMVHGFNNRWGNIAGVLSATQGESGILYRGRER